MSIVEAKKQSSKYFAHVLSIDTVDLSGLSLTNICLSQMTEKKYIFVSDNILSATILSLHRLTFVERHAACDTTLLAMPVAKTAACIVDTIPDSAMYFIIFENETVFMNLMILARWLVSAAAASVAESRDTDEYLRLSTLAIARGPFPKEASFAKWTRCRNRYIGHYIKDDSRE